MLSFKQFRTMLTQVKTAGCSFFENKQEYRGLHYAPSTDLGCPAHDLTKVYPEDVYSKQGSRLYGSYRSDDEKILSLLRSIRNQPNASIKIYRAIPSTISKEQSIINPGDWVAISSDYAKDHGIRVLDNKFKILTKTVKAKHIFTNGDSFHEWGYFP